MEVRLTVNPETNFKAQLSQDFINAARHHYAKSPSPKPFRRFLSKMAEFHNFPNSDDVKIIHDKVSVGGKLQHVLYAVKEGMKREEWVVLTTKDCFRKLVEKFTHINKYEFELKMEQAQKSK